MERNRLSQLRAHVVVTGIVQGVFFRQSTKHRAAELGLAGWVRNLPDGRVEAYVIGERTKVEQMLEFLKKGPTSAQVDNIEIRFDDAIDGDEVVGFSIIK